MQTVEPELADRLHEAVSFLKQKRHPVLFVSLDVQFARVAWAACSELYPGGEHTRLGLLITYPEASIAFAHLGQSPDVFSGTEARIIFAPGLFEGAVRLGAAKNRGGAAWAMLADRNDARLAIRGLL